MSPVQKVSDKMMTVSRLSSCVGVSKVKTPSPSPASYQVVAVPPPSVGFYKKPEEASSSSEEAAFVSSPPTLAKLPSKRWEAESTASKTSLSITSRL